MAEWINAEVKEVKNWSGSLFSLRVKAPIEPFIAGQYAKLGLEINGERVQRAYSYVNAPNDDLLEFYLVTVPDGKLSPHLQVLQSGDQIMISKDAAGYFVLDEVPECKNLWMLATGTAVGPYLSMLQQGENLDRFENIVFVHAARYSADLSFLPLMQKLKKRYPDKLRIQTVVSRDTHIGSLTGRITTLIDNGELERTIGIPLDIDSSHVMLCGNPEMVRDTQQLLIKKLGMRKHLKRKPGHITSENYW